MSRIFNGVSDYLSGLPPVTSYPYAISVWAKPAISAQMIMIEASNPSGFSTGGIAVQMSDAKFYLSRSGDDVPTTGSVPVGSWSHVYAVVSSVNSASIYFNGGNKAFSSVSCPTTGISRMDIGRHFNGPGNPVAYFSGNLAEIAIWNTVPANADTTAAALASGISPTDISGLVSYWKLDGSGSQEIDLISGRILTAVGTTASTDNPIVNGMVSPPPIPPPIPSTYISYRPIYALMGQSNVIQLLPALQEFATVVNAGIQGATPIAQWAAGAPLDPVPLIGSTPIDALIIGQGESDATIERYPLWSSAVRTLIARVRTAQNRPTLPVLILSVIQPRTPNDPYLELIRAAQRDVACDPNNIYLDTTIFRHIPAGTPEVLPDFFGGEHLYLDAQPQQAAAIRAVLK